jgi:hypothetical protein
MESSNIDPLLMSLAIAAENNESTNLTLLVNGNIIQGRLISKQIYLSGIRDSLPVDEQANSSTAESSKMIGYLHLTDVVLQQSIRIQFLRIQPSFVSGFWFSDLKL